MVSCNEQWNCFERLHPLAYPKSITLPLYMHFCDGKEFSFYLAVSLEGLRVTPFWSWRTYP